MKHKNTSWLLVAALAILGAQASWAADVVSSNIVGYNKIALNSGYNLLGTQFRLVGGTEGALAEVFDAKELPGLDENGDFQAEVRLWTGTGYRVYGWAGFLGDDEDSAPLNYKWLNQDYEATEISAPAGTAFWVKTTDSADVVSSGEVPEEDTKTVALSTGLNMVANPFPESISIQTIQSDDLPGLDENGDFTAELRIWTGTGYKTYGWSGFLGDDEDSAPLNYSWLNQDYEKANETIAIGTGFWIKTAEPANITFTK